MCVHVRARALAARVYRSALQPSTMFEGESSAATLLGVEKDLQQSGLTPEEGSVESELCTLGALGS